MRPIKTILVPIDFSDVAANAFKYALRLADRLDASIDLLYVVPQTGNNFMSLSQTEILVQVGREKIGKFFTENLITTTSQLKYIPAVRTKVETGNLREVISRYATEHHSDLIVMGTKGEDNDQADNLFGSNTSLLVNITDCPVLVIPDGFSFRPPASICYATDLEHTDAFHAGHLLRVLRNFTPRLDFVHVKTGKSGKTSFNMDLLREVFDQPETGIKTRFHILEDEDVVEELFDYAEATSADLVVMHRPRRRWFDNLFGVSNTREATLGAMLPLLILPEEAPEEQPPGKQKDAVEA